jgi:hypothetical protein
LFFQGSLLVPAKWPGVAPLGAGSVTRARRIARSLTARGAERAPLGAARPLRRDEVRGEQLSARVQSVRSCEPTQAYPDALAQQLRAREPRVTSRESTEAHPDAQTQQALTRLDDAMPSRVDLPHSRAARAGVSPHVYARDGPRTGAREHEFGEGRAPAGGAAAEDARVGAPPALDVPAGNAILSPR